jgi:hypothetical protein
MAVELVREPQIHLIVAHVPAARIGCDEPELVADAAGP